MEKSPDTVAIFGGTFDPPTKAHESIIGACLNDSAMDEVWLMPSGARADKPGMQSDEARLAMLALVRHQVFHDDPRLKISRFELDLPRPTQTYRTVQAIKANYPDKQFWYVFGADSYETMQDWEQGEYLKNHLKMLLVERLGYELPEDDDNIRNLRIHAKIIQSGLSSTMVRQALAAGEPITDKVCPAVADYMISQMRSYALQ